MTPVVYPNEAAGDISDIEAEAIEEGQDVMEYQSRYQHVMGAQTIIIPYETLLSLGGGAGRLKAVAVKFVGHGPAHGRKGGMDQGDGHMGAMGSDEHEGPRFGPGSDKLAQELSDRFGMMIFKGGPHGTSLFFASNTMSYQGVANILIPVVISMLIVLNTMISSVYERKREIAVYTSVGLAPSHVSFLFVAEAMAFAVISVVIGYLLAQTSAVFLSGTALWAGMTANYSSTAGVAAMILVMGVVLLSTLYPSRVAAQIAIPDVNRSWSMPEPDGDVLMVTLPFLIKITEQTCVGGFLLDYYDSYRDISHGLFTTDALACDLVHAEKLPEFTRTDRSKKEVLHGKGNGKEKGSDVCFQLQFRTWLAPFDFGVRQRVNLILCPSESYEGFREIKVRIVREAGESTVWQDLNKKFLNDLRKQLLVWRSLEEDARNTYEHDLNRYLTGKGKEGLAK